MMYNNCRTDGRGKLLWFYIANARIHGPATSKVNTSDSVGRQMVFRKQCTWRVSALLAYFLYEGIKEK